LQWLERGLGGVQKSFKKMAAKDLYHTTVKTALQKDGWTITHDPLYLKHEGLKMAIDLGAEQVIAASKDAEQIAVEIKSFATTSVLYAYHESLGQFRTYRRILKKKEPERTLFLAVPVEVYDEFFKQPFGIEAIEEEDLKLLVFNPITQEIITWIK
jgi:hypothetical protein